MLKHIGWFFGILLTGFGLFFILIYLNLLIMGYSFLEFVKFISRSFECYLFLIGIVIIVINIERIKK